MSDLRLTIEGLERKNVTTYIQSGNVIFDATEAKAVTARAMADNKASEAVLRKAGLRWQSEMPVELPVRSGTFLTSFWRLDREAS